MGQLRASSRTTTAAGAGAGAELDLGPLGGVRGRGQERRRLDGWSAVEVEVAGVEFGREDGRSDGGGGGGGGGLWVYGADEEFVASEGVALAVELVGVVVIHYCVFVCLAEVAITV